MVSEPGNRLSSLCRELIALIDTVAAAERERDARLDAKLNQLATQMRETERIQALITGGAARREARLRALEDIVEAMAAERSRYLQPKPLDIPTGRVDASILEMRLDDD